jgi:16S rRNA G966 N2-methylase RsmD
MFSAIEELDLREQYDVILMDPPWENKHVKRKRNSSLGYNMLHNSQIQAGEQPKN